MIYMSNTDDRKVLLQQTPDEMILQYAENRQALFNSAMDKDPLGCFVSASFTLQSRITELS